MSHLFAIIPAAGLSRRMGRPKLLIPWAGATVIDQVVRVFRRPEITLTVVVIRPGDVALRQAVESTGARVLEPADPPPEMRDSVECALRLLADEFQPGPDDGWILSPADQPLLSAAVLTALLSRWQEPGCLILAPACQGKRGHPVVFRWSLAAEVLDLPPDAGLNVIVRRHADRLIEVPVSDPGILIDLDTPADWEQLCKHPRPPPP